jgi:glycerol-1-phosphate dehydrogenase [NAD(P)+]
MDGYASSTSSMTVDGLKMSLNIKCADVIIGDTDILARAPLKMMASGIGDMLAKYVSICEWRISHLINGEYYCPEIAKLVRGSLNKCVNNADKLLKRDPDAVEAVFEGLVVCGAAMKYAGLSRPASGVEHYLSHVWDMRGAEFGIPTELHGVQCAYGTLLAVKLYNELLKLKPVREKALAYVHGFKLDFWHTELSAFLGKGARSMIELEKKEGKYDKLAHKERLEKIIANFDKIKSIIKEELPELDKLEALLVSLSLPTKSTEAGIDKEILAKSFFATRDIRDKYVLSRLVWDLGIPEITDAISDM